MRDVIRLSGVKKAYDNRTALDIPVLELKKGCATAILGPNGSGKTTLLRVLAGLTGHEGTVEGLGLCAVMEQSPYLFDYSVEKNVALGGVDLDVAEYYEKLELAHLKNRNARRLSGGETQRVALLRTIATGRRTLILDEPTASADIRSILLVETVLAELIRENYTIIFSTHAPSQAERQAQRAVMMWDGRAIENAEVKALLHRPEHGQTRMFLEYWRQ